jgi:outer membrane protein OmpA-like peptidoglycan-associated protein
MRKFGVAFSWAAISLLLVTSLASAEPYFGLYAGAAFPFENDLTIGNFATSSNLTADLKVRNNNGDTSGILGGKFGYFLDPLPFLGFELDAFNIFGPDFDFNRTRKIDSTIGVVGRPDLGGVSSTQTRPLSDFGVGPEGEVGLTGVMLDIVGRLPLMRSQEFPVGRLHPYIGVGGGWVNARLDVPNNANGGTFSDTSNTWGAQGLAGLRYFVSPNVALFAEGKYLYIPNVAFKDGATRAYTDFNLATASGGISFHFPPPVAPPQAVIETIVLQSVHFEFDKSSLTPLGRRVLDEAAQKLKDNPRLTVVIEGNTDSIGTELYNLGLGQRRAEVVMGYLVLRHQVDPKRMTPLSYGESRPIADNRTAEGRALNRRVEFKVLVR